MRYEFLMFLDALDSQSLLDSIYVFKRFDMLAVIFCEVRLDLLCQLIWI